MKITFRTQARKSLQNVPIRRANAIRRALVKIADDPRRGDVDVRTLTGHPGFRLRVGSWRVIYEIEGDTIEVMLIAPRKDAYRKKR